MAKLVLPKNKSKRPKYGNTVRKDNQGTTWHSGFEHTRWLHLKQQEASGHISNLQRQVNYPLVVNGVLVCTYKADYVYEEAGVTVVEDAKGVITPIFSIKAKLFRAVYGYDIKVVMAEPQQRQRRR